MVPYCSDESQYAKSIESAIESVTRIELVIEMTVRTLSPAISR